MNHYKYIVPKEKQLRILISTDCANEADDQYALAHALMSPKLEVMGIIAAHFDNNMNRPQAKDGPRITATQSYEEILTVLDKMNLPQYKNLTTLGAQTPLLDTAHPNPSEGAKQIIAEALRADPRPLYIGCQGSLTDLASAILMEPSICDKMTAIWIGGGDYPEGGFEFNLLQDINAANVLFSSSMPVWQIPMKVYKTLTVSLAELQLKVASCGEFGSYLFENMVRLNQEFATIPHWPHGELWTLGDQGVMAALMQESERTDNFYYQRAPKIREDMTYDLGTGYREIRIYTSLDYRLVLEDFFAKLKLCYGQEK